MGSKGLIQYLIGILTAAFILATFGAVPAMAVSLLNGDFELPRVTGTTLGVATDWTSYQRAPNPDTVWSIKIAPPLVAGQYQQIANTSASGGGGVRQSITGCTSGLTYTIAGWMRTNSALATAQVKVSPTESADWSTAVALTPAAGTTSTVWVAFSGTVVATSTSMTVWLDGTTGGTAENKAVCFDSITVVECTSPAAPTGGTATVNSTTQITWGWTAGSGASDYKSYAASSGGTGTSLGNVVTWPESGLNANTSYTHYISSVSATCENSARLQVGPKYTLANVPGAPVVNNPQSGSVDVNPATVTDGALIAITVGGGGKTLGTDWVQAGGTVGTTAVWQTEASWATRTVTGLTNETQYTFKVRARNGDNIVTADSTGATGTPSNLCVAVTAATPIGNLTVCSGTTTSLTETPSAGTAPYTYQWQISTDNGANFANCVEGVDGATVTSATMTTKSTAVNGTKYKCYVTNCSAAYNSTSAVVTLTVNPLPVAPTSVLAWLQAAGKSAVAATRGT